MATENKHVVFDIVGTCVSYDAFFEAIEARLGGRLRAEGISPGRLFGYAWMETGEKEYTYMSLTGKYVPFFDIFRSIFYRVLGQAGVKNPREFATDEDREFLLASYRTLRARPGLLECFEKLRAAGYTVWALTSGDTARVAGYLETAGAKFPEEHFFSCDSIGIGKPAPSAYKFIKDKFPKENLDLWFAAAHIWDAAAAKQCGFKGAWASVWEGEPSPDIYGEMEVTADSLIELADNIVAYKGSK